MLTEGSRQIYLRDKMHITTYITGLVGRRSIYGPAETKALPMIEITAFFNPDQFHYLIYPEQENSLNRKKRATSNFHFVKAK